VERVEYSEAVAAIVDVNAHPGESKAKLLDTKIPEAGEMSMFTPSSGVSWLPYRMTSTTLLRKSA
jgi:hypothetical protein